MTWIHLVTMTAFLLTMMGLTVHLTHLLSTLLCLEALMLILFMALAAWTLDLHLGSSFVLPMLLLTLSACEASTGLALLTATTRTHTTTQLSSMNMLQC
uniref:NADH-ubiquinone oxidoreductase chain 4L n=1 Tax=Batrachomoeus trispinosus TaxID=262770 RepID=Q5GM96_9TELE|nr:NADH dehydrogenase subunit 4L [Batrachomoeus trispinosus]